jgi:hypothetical protein
VGVEGLCDLQQHPLAIRISPIRVILRDMELGHEDVVVGRDRVVVDEEATVRGVVWMECQPQRPLLLGSLDSNLLRQIEERLLAHGSVRLHDADRSLPLDHEDPSAPVGRKRQVDRLVQSARDLDELNLRVTGEVAAEEGRAAFIDLCNWCRILR